MDADRLIGIIRSDYLDDDVKPYRWDTEKLLRWLDLGQTEACRRQRLIVDDTSEDVCRLTTVPLRPRYDLDPRVMLLMSLTRPDGTPIVKTTENDLNHRFQNWRLWEPGYPTHYIQAGLEITLFPAPATEEVLSLRVWRLPLNPITKATDLLEIDPAYQEDLAHYVAAKAFRMPDEDLRDMQVAQWHEDQFNATFGPALRADVLAAWRRDGDVAFVQGHAYHGRKTTPFDIC